MIRNTILTALVMSLSLGVAGCDKKEEKKDDKKAETKKKDDKKGDDKKADAKADGGDEKAADGGDEKKADDGGEAAADGGEAAADDLKTGIEECDELWKRSMCAFGKIPDAAAQKTAKDAFAQSAQAWKDMAANDATKEAAKTSCKAAVDASGEAWKAQGC